MKSFRPKDCSGEPSAPGRNGARCPRQDEEQREALDPLCCARPTTDPGAGSTRRQRDSRAKVLALPGATAAIENRSDPVVAACVTPGLPAPPSRRLPVPWPKNSPAGISASRSVRTRPMTLANSCRRNARGCADHPAPGAERYQPGIRDRRPHRAPSRFRGQPGEAETDEEVSGWMKTVARMRKTRHRGTARVGLHVHLHRCCLQPGADAEVAGRRGVVRPGVCPKIAPVT